MKRLSGLAAGMLMMTAGATVSAFDQISVYRFDSQLKQIGPRVWKVDGEPLAPVYVVPGSGDILALVKPAAGTVLQLERWTSEGKPVSRRAVDVGDIVASQLAPDGSALILATASELVTIPVGVAPSPAPEVRHALPDTVKGGKQVSIGPAGAWFGAGAKLIHVGLDGRTSVSIDLPLVKDVPPQPEGVRPGTPGPGQGPWRFLGERRLVALADGGVVVVETVDHVFQIKQSDCDVVSIPTFTAVAPDGKVRGRMSLGEVETTSDWFWSERSPSNPSWLPERMGLRRTRHTGGEYLVGLGPKGASDLLVLSGKTKLQRFDATLKKVWSTSLKDSGIDVLSPSWTRGVAYHRYGRLYTLGDNGKESRWSDYFDAAAMTRPARVAIQVAVGQTPAGEWLIVNY